MHFQYAHLVNSAFGPSLGVGRRNVVVVGDDAGDNGDEGDDGGDQSNLQRAYLGRPWRQVRVTMTA